MSQKPQKIYIQEGIEVEVKDVLGKELIEERKKVLLVGEGNFTFTTAFAAHREAEKSHTPPRNPGTWDGITATHKEPIAGEDHFPKVVKTCKQECTSAEEVKHLDALEEPPPDSWRYGIDGCHLRDYFPRESFDLIWFQCPWNGSSTRTLVQYFLLSASHIVRCGGHVCIGITTHKGYVDCYGLKELTSSPPSNQIIQDIHERYDLPGGRPYADTALVEKVLSFGYRHQGKRDIHEYIRKDHVTLVFERKRHEADKQL